MLEVNIVVVNREWGSQVSCPCVRVFTLGPGGHVLGGPWGSEKIQGYYLLEGLNLFWLLTV